MNYRGIELVERDGKHYFEDEGLQSVYLGYTRGWPRKNFSIGLRQAWVDEMKARPSRGGVRCLCKVAMGHNRRCTRDTPSPRSGVHPLCAVSRQNWHHWFDHSEQFWLPATRGYALTGQPYSVSLERFKAMEAVAQEHGLALTVSMVSAWHNPGRCPLLVWLRLEPGETPSY